MEQYSVKISELALQDLEEIYTYLVESLREPNTASKLVARIENAILSLEQRPYRCPERRTGAYANRGYRNMNIENFSAVYRVQEESKTVMIVAVRYAPSQF